MIWKIIRITIKYVITPLFFMIPKPSLVYYQRKNYKQFVHVGDIIDFSITIIELLCFQRHRLPTITGVVIPQGVDGKKVCAFIDEKYVKLPTLNLLYLHWISFKLFF